MEKYSFSAIRRVQIPSCSLKKLFLSAGVECAPYIFERLLPLFPQSYDFRKVTLVEVEFEDSAFLERFHFGLEVVCGATSSTWRLSDQLVKPATLDDCLVYLSYLRFNEGGVGKRETGIVTLGTGLQTVPGSISSNCAPVIQPDGQLELKQWVDLGRNSNRLRFLFRHLQL